MSDEAKSVTYSSTRGDPSQNGLSFRDVVMRGLAHDRGLFVPDSYSRACGRRKHLQQLAQIADHLLEKRDISLRYVTI